MHTFPLRCKKLFALFLVASASCLLAQVPSVTTAEYDNGRTTANNSEFLLNPFDVNVDHFGKVGSYSVDGQVVGQPLYMPGMQVGHLRVNVLYVTTMNNSVYALDADHPGAAPLWMNNFGPAVPPTYAGACPAQYSMGNQMGILGTPVIDPSTNTIYFVAATTVAKSPTYIETLYALDLLTGQQKLGGSIVLTGSVPGTGTTSANGVVTLSRTMTAQRPGLLLSNGTVYVGLSSCGPNVSPYHGWVLGYSAYNIKQQVAVYNSTPNGDKGGIWQGGRGLVADAAGSIYVATGNGSTDDITNFGESFVKLAPNGSIEDWFTPLDAAVLTTLDLDLSTTSPLLTPDTNLLIGGSKLGTIYVMPAASLGKLGIAYQTFPDGPACPEAYNGCQKIHSMAYWAPQGTSAKLFLWGNNDVVRSYRFSLGRFVTTSSSQGTQVADYPGGILTVTSANRLAATGILWALTTGELHAFSANNVGEELWNSNQNAGRDALPGNYHFEQFTVVAGRVYVPDNENHVVVYGLLR